MVAIIDDLVLAFIATTLGQVILAGIVGFIALVIGSFFVKSAALTLLGIGLPLLGLYILFKIAVPQLAKKDSEWQRTVALAFILIILGVTPFLANLLTGQGFSFSFVP